MGKWAARDVRTPPEVSDDYLWSLIRGAPGITESELFRDVRCVQSLGIVSGVPVERSEIAERVGRLARAARIVAAGGGWRAVVVAAPPGPQGTLFWR